MGEGSSHAGKGTSVDEAPSPSAPPRGCGGGSAKKKVLRILVDAPRAILPRMRRSFVDMKYLPLTSMDRSEWEIILEELIRMRFIVKEEPVSEGDD
jgi:hypothetical protein